MKLLQGTSLFRRRKLADAELFRVRISGEVHSTNNRQVVAFTSAPESNAFANRVACR